MTLPSDPEELEQDPAATDAAADAAAGEETPAPDHRLSFAGIEVQLPDTNPVVILQETDEPYRVLQITIGSTEGVAIAYAWRRIPTPKPLTHELFADVMRAFGVTVDFVRITDVKGSSFSAELVLSGRPGPRTVPCRPSDGIALALRQRLAVPILATDAVMQAAARLPG
jgi:bifunctional DNase/RNase